MKRIIQQGLLNVAQRVLELSWWYSTEYGELWYDGLLLGYLEGRFGGMDRQRSVPKGRIDFRQGGNRPVVIELAVGKRNTSNKIYGSQNKGELHKLARETSASTRYLLLLDPSQSEPIPEDSLRHSYKQVPAERGRFPRGRVRVMYVHQEDSYSFLWP